MEKLYYYFFILIGLLSLSEATKLEKSAQIISSTSIEKVQEEEEELPEKWNTSLIIKYMNMDPEFANQTYGLFDPHNRLHDGITNDTKIFYTSAKEQGINTYFMVLYNWTKEGDINLSEVAEEYSYPSESSKDSSCFIAFVLMVRKYMYFCGSKHKERITDNYMNNLFERALNEQQKLVFDEGEHRIIIRGMRNAYVTPASGWFASDFADFIYKNNNTINYIISNPNWVIPPGEEGNFTKEFDNILEMNFHVYMILFADHFYQYNTTEKIGNLTEDAFKSEWQFLPQGAKLKNSIFAFYSIGDTDLFDIKAGSDITFTEGEYNQLLDCGKEFTEDNYKKSFYCVLNYLMYDISDKVGWTPKMFNEQLHLDYIHTQTSFFYYNDETKPVGKQGDYISEILQFLENKEYGFNTYIFVVNKINSQYSVNSFLNELKDLFNPEGVDKDNMIEIILSIKDNKDFDISLGSKAEKIITDKILQKIKSNFQERLSSSKLSYYDSIIGLLRDLRYYIAIEEKIETGLSPSLLSSYINDKSNGSDYFYLEYKELITEEQYEKYLEYMKMSLEFETHIYFIAIDKIDLTVEKDIHNYTRKTLSYLTSQRGPVSAISDSFVLIFYSNDQSLFAFNYSKNFESDFKNKIKKIFNGLSKYDNFYEKGLHLLKMTNYYASINKNEWTVKSLNFYCKDFVGKVENLLLDVGNSISKQIHGDYLKNYLIDLSSQGVYSYFFMLTKEKIYLKQDVKENEADNFVEELYKTYELPEHVDKEDTLFIVCSPENKTYQFKMGKNVNAIITDARMIELIDKAQAKIPWDKDLYFSVKYLTMNIKKIIYESKKVVQKWTPQQVADIYNKNYQVEFGDFMFVDYEGIAEDETETAIKNSMFNLADDFGANVYFYLLNEVSDEYKDNMGKFINELKDKFDYTKAVKELTVIIVFFKESKVSSTYSGTYIKNLLTTPNMNELAAKYLNELTEVKPKIHNILTGYLREIIDSAKVQTIYTVDEIREIIVNSTQSYFFFDPHKNLYPSEYNDTLEKILDIRSNELYMFNFILADYPKSNDNSILKDYVQKIADKIPTTKENEGKDMAVVVVVTKTSEIEIVLVNDAKSRVSATKIKKMRDKAILDYRQGSLKDALENLFNDFINNVCKKKKSSSKAWKITAIVAIVVIIIIVAIFFIFRHIKKIGSKPVAKLNPSENNVINSAEPLNI